MWSWVYCDSLHCLRATTIGDVRPTSITLHLADQDPADILGDIPAIVGNFAFPVDFVVLEM